MSKKYVPISLKDIKTYPLKRRKSKVRLDALGESFNGGDFKDFLRSLPKTLSAKNFKEIVDAIVKAKKTGNHQKN